MRLRVVPAFTVSIALALAAPAGAQERPAPPSEEVLSLPAIRVIAPSPLSAGSSGVDRDKVPAMTHSLSTDDLSRGDRPT